MHFFKEHLKKYTKESILAPLFKLLEACMDLCVPLVVARMINNGIVVHNTRNIILYAALLIVLAFVGMGFSFIAQWFAAKASVGFASDVRSSLYKHIQSFQYQDIDTLGSDTLITRLTSDVNQVQTGLNLTLRLLLRSPFIVFGSMVLAFTIDVKSAFIFVCVIPLLCVVVFGIMLVSIPLFTRVQKALDSLTESTRENLSGVRVIRAFRKEKEETQLFINKNKKLTNMNLIVARLSSLMNPLSFLLINFATMALLYVDAFQVQLGVLKQGDVVALYNYMAQISVELIKMASLIITINKSVACAKRIQNVIEKQPSFTYKDADVQIHADAPLLEMEDVSFTYPNATLAAIDHIHVKLFAGKTLGIIGGTGAGKSTLINVIPRFYEATMGCVKLHGVDVKDYPASLISQMIGIVPQKAILFEGTIRSNLLMAKKDASEEEMMEALRIAQAKDIVDSKGLDSHIEQNGRNLSGGQRQRLTIARAVLKKPELLILDDSSSALDFRTDLELRKALHNLSSTVIIVAQRVASVKNCDEILVIDDGLIKERGTHEELLNMHGIYEEINNSQTSKEVEHAK